MNKTNGLEPGSAYLLTWKPKRWALDLAYFVRHPKKLDEWATGNTKTVEIGAPFFFLRQGSDLPGIIGWGRIRSQVRQQRHWADERHAAGKQSNEVEIELEFLTMPDDRRAIPRAVLETDRRTKAGHWVIQSSGTRLSPDVAEGVRRLFIERRVAVPPMDAVLAGQRVEGAATQVTTTVYETNRENRRDCIRIHGCRCMACGFEFSRHYGPQAVGMIEVHHLNPLSRMGKQRAVDPRKDLVPLCANCHRAIHMTGKGEAPLTIRELKNLLRKHGDGFAAGRG